MSRSSHLPEYLLLEPARPSAPTRSRGLFETLRITLDAMREGHAASRHYEALRGRGIPHEQAITRAVAETGFGS